MMPLFKVGDILYRARARVSYTEFGDRVVIRYETWHVVRTTKYMMWLSTHPLVQPWEVLPGHGSDNWVELTEAEYDKRVREHWGSLRRCAQHARVKFAWRTQLEAMNSLAARTHWRVIHAEHRLAEAKAIKQKVDSLIREQSLQEFK
jgi:hypothetical protein